MENDDPILEAIGEVGPGEIAKRWDHRKGACIASTAVGLIVCKHFGISAEPVCVEAIVGNAEFARRLADGWKPFASHEEAIASGAHYIVIDTKHRIPGGFGGHMVVGLRDANYVLDLGLGQFKRPAKNIMPPSGALFTVSKDFWTGSECQYTLSHGECVLFSILGNPPDWTASPDWKRAHEHHEIAKKIIRKVTRKLTTEKTL